MYHEMQESTKDVCSYLLHCLLAMGRFWRTRRGLSLQNLVLGFFMSYSGTHAIPPVLLDIGDDPDDLPTFYKEVPFV